MKSIHRGCIFSHVWKKRLNEFAKKNLKIILFQNEKHKNRDACNNSISIFTTQGMGHLQVLMRESEYRFRDSWRSWKYRLELFVKNNKIYYFEGSFWRIICWLNYLTTGLYGTGSFFETSWFQSMLLNHLWLLISLEPYQKAQSISEIV